VNRNEKIKRKTGREKGKYKWAEEREIVQKMRRRHERPRVDYAKILRLCTLWTDRNLPTNNDVF
jgi:hypothetical protein